MRKNTIPKKRMNPALAAMSRRARDNRLISAAGKANKIITLMVLHDKFNFTQDQIQEFVNAYQAELERPAPERESRVIPLYRTPAAAGYAAPVFGEDFDYLAISDEIPQAAEFAVRIQGDSMVPYIADGDVVYVNRDPLAAGDVGIFCVDGEMFCKQYYKDPAGTVYLFSLNRARSDADLVLTAGSGRTLVCFGRVILHAPPLPGRP